MRLPIRLLLGLSLGLALSQGLLAQSAGGTLDVSARLSPTGARPEPVRQYIFYILTRSYADIVKEVQEANPLPSRQEFIEKLKVSAELKTWLLHHEIMDLTQIDLDKLVTPEDIITVPEFLAAYQRSNSGGVTSGLPQPKFKESDRETNPDRYNKQKSEYLNAMKKFMEAHPSTISGMELELGAVSPHLQWEKLKVEQHQRIEQLAPDIAESKYTVAKVETDLEGHGSISGLKPGSYWVSSLGIPAVAGDRRVSWDVPAIVEAGSVTRVNLSNVNSTKPGLPLS